MNTLGLSGLPESLQADMVAIAGEFVDRDLGLTFSDDECRALIPFFTNLNKRVFFMHSLSSNVLATLGSMFSRLKNPRGIRGIFVDSFLPGILAGTIENYGFGDVDVFLRDKNIKNLGDFIAYSPQAREKFEWFIRNSPDEIYSSLMADSKKAKRFLSMWLDSYGHNSIARMGSVYVCYEQISILAAKSIEWTRPGAGYVELSTRFVDRESAGVYPIEKELVRLGYEQSLIRNNFSALSRDYGNLQGDKMDGPLPSFLRKRWAEEIVARGGNLELGIAGETYDVLGNLLPAATLTSVAVSAGGESLPNILKHLILDDTAEGRVLVDMTIREAGKIGADQFIRHHEPTPSEVAGWAYETTAVKNFRKDCGLKAFINVMDSELVEHLLAEAFQHKSLFAHAGRLRGMMNMANVLFGERRKPHDKLPREFELVTVPFWGVMSFRGWRDLQRQGFSTHRRTLLKPNYGFYRYDKPHPIELDESFSRNAEISRRLYYELSDVPKIIRQYLLPMGFSVGFMYSANLRQHEFCNWQRTKPSVNHEVRQVFLSGERELRRIYPWWPLFSRADMTSAYIFARGSAVPL